MAINSIPFEPEHLQLCELRDHENKLLNRERLIAVAKYGFAQTMFCAGEVVAVIGYFEIHESVIEVFLVPTVALPRFAVSTIRELKKFLYGLGENHHRIQTSSLANEQTDKWMRVLGFQCEGTLRQFTVAKLDYRVWSIVRQDNG